MLHDIQPVMSEEFHIVLENDADAETAERQLNSITVDGRPAMRVHREGNDLLVGCGIFDRVEGAPTLSATGRPDIPFFDLFYLADGLKSGMHHPDGILWIRGADRSHEVHRERIPLRNVAPTILDLFGIDASATMPGAVIAGAMFASAPR